MQRRGGTGLGLPISRRIVEHLGGRLWLDEAYAGGARFIVELPLLAARQPADVH